MSDSVQNGELPASMRQADEAARGRKLWGWGREDERLDETETAMLDGALGAFFGRSVEPAPPPKDLPQLPAPRFDTPASLSDILSDDPFERALHSYGRSYRDLVRARRSEYPRPPDLVALPKSEADISRILDACAERNVAVVPYGGGSSVCGGVEPFDIGDKRGAVSLDLRRLNRVLEVDAISRAARIQAGGLGPAIEAQLKPHGLSLRHYPQSFEQSSLGGWIATRAGGHFAMLPTHIDEMVEGLRMVTPTGTWTTRRLPGSGAGPSPDRMVIGSEGILGVITEAWMKLTPRPRFRASASVSFPSFGRGADALRDIAQSGLLPANCRLLDEREAMINGAGAGDAAILVLGFESADHPLGPWIQRAVELCRAHGGTVPDSGIKLRDQGEKAHTGSDDAAGTWRRSFLRGPHLRDGLVARGVFVETYETAITWERLSELVERVRNAASAAARATLTDQGVAPVVTCRVTHAYTDGAAPYFTVLCPARVGDEIAQWNAIKQGITDEVLAAGGTVTHHHAVGRDTRPFYDRQRPDLFARALGAAKRELDPSGILNPGVLLPAM